MKSKIICLILAMVMVIAALVSCGGGGGGEGGGQGGGGQGGGGQGGSGSQGSSNADVYWRKTPIVYSLTEAADSNSFPSGCRRYYAGEVKGGTTEEIDIMISQRNDAAEVEANVTVDYQYVPNTSANDHSFYGQTIFNNSTAYNPGTSVDIYCNFTYDLTCASLKNCFANLKANTDLVSTTYGMGKNFFAFNEEGYEYIGENYFDSSVGQGYFYQYMLSLTLSDDKVYCLGSDYCTDLVRAFHVIPVNIELMNKLRANMIPAATGKDENGNDVTITKNADETNIEHFYRIVWGGGWTFEVLSKYSRAVFQDTGVGGGADGSGISGADLTDTLGFAISTNGIPSSGILYTSTVEILDKKALTPAEREAALADENMAPYVSGNYLITYPETNSDFVTYANALLDLFKNGQSAGIAVVGGGDREKVKNQFVSGNVLFGNIINLGSLEEAEYQNMRKGDGFGIVPVPVYRYGDEYQTFVHNNSRIIAIARMTDRYEQCAAYLDYQSTHSSEILDKYYNEELAQSVSNSSGDDNERMLVYIRNHVRNVFDKTYEDVMGDFNKEDDANATKNRWHEIFATAFYQVSGMEGEYKSRLDMKSANLKKVIAAWNSLGNED
ncbi:MAG: hypothetical protein IJY69_03700 [Clostridia bacterium]|nr:hypothetical protein [Clostridia bacterium]